MGQIDNIMLIMEGKCDLQRRQSIGKSARKLFLNMTFKSTVSHREFEVRILAVSGLG